MVAQKVRAQHYSAKAIVSVLHSSTTHYLTVMQSAHNYFIKVVIRVFGNQDGQSNLLESTEVIEDELKL